MVDKLSRVTLVSVVESVHKRYKRVWTDYDLLFEKVVLGMPYGSDLTRSNVLRCACDVRKKLFGKYSPNGYVLPTNGKKVVGGSGSSGVVVENLDKFSIGKEVSKETSKPISRQNETHSVKDSVGKLAYVENVDVLRDLVRKKLDKIYMKIELLEAGIDKVLDKQPGHPVSDGKTITGILERLITEQKPINEHHLYYLFVERYVKRNYGEILRGYEKGQCKAYEAFGSMDKIITIDDFISAYRVAKLNLGI